MTIKAMQEIIRNMTEDELNALEEMLYRNNMSIEEYFGVAEEEREDNAYELAFGKEGQYADEDLSDLMALAQYEEEEEEDDELPF